MLQFFNNMFILVQIQFLKLLSTIVTNNFNLLWISHFGIFILFITVNRAFDIR